MNKKLWFLLLLLLGISSFCAALAVLSVDSQVSSANVSQGTIKKPIYHFHLLDDSYSPYLTGLNFTTYGTYSSSDVTRFQLWWGTTDALSSASQLGGDLTGGPGVHSWSQFWYPIYSHATQYVWIVADISPNAVTTKTMYATVQASDIILRNEGVSGSAGTGGTQTITNFASLSTDYFRSNTSSGNWSAPGSWQSSHDASYWATATLSPSSSAYSITILSGHTITVTSNVSTSNTIIDYGGQINVNSGYTMTIANGKTMTVNGTLRNNAGTITTTGSLSFGDSSLYQSNFSTTVGLIPTATWNANSTCEIMGYTTFSGTQTGLGQTFGNFKWNCPDQTTNISANSALVTIKGNLTMNATNTGSFRLIANTASTLALTGSLIINGGTLNMSSGTGSAVINLAGNLTMTGGTLTETGSGLANNINFTSYSVISISETATISYTINFAVTNGSIMDFENSNTVLGGSNGTFTTVNGSTLYIRHAEGIAMTGNNTGCIQTTGTRTFNSNVTYYYLGTTPQITGSGLPATVTNLNSNNISGVGLSGSYTVSGTLQLFRTLAIGSNTLTIGGSVSGSGTLVGGTTSNISVTGTGNVTLPSVSTLNNLTINRSGTSVSVTLGGDCTVEGVLTFSAGNVTITSPRTLTIDGTVIFNAANFVTGTGSFILAAGATLQTTNTVGITSSGSTGSVQTTIRNLSNQANYIYNGTLAQSTGNGLPNTIHDLIINNATNVTLSSLCTVLGSCQLLSGNLSLASSTLTIMGFAIFNATNFVTGSGNFVLNSGATLQTANTSGIASSGNTGSVQTTIRNLSTGANYIYNGNTAQFTGTGLPSNVQNLTISNPITVTLSGSCAVDGTFSVSSGSFNVGSYSLTINGIATFNATNYVNGAGSFVLSNGATLQTANTSGITIYPTASGSVQTASRIFNLGAIYSYNGTSTQVSGTGFPDLCTGTLEVNTSNGISFSLSEARTMSANGNVNLVSGIFNAGTSLTMGSGSTITRSNGIITGTIQGSSPYSVIYSGINKQTGSELSGTGLGNITINLESGNTLTLDRSLTVDNNEHITFIQGSLSLANYNIIMNGSYNDANQFIYTGTGVLSGGNVGNAANVIETVTSPVSIPSVVNTLTIEPGVGNIVTLPNSIAATNLIISNGSIALNNHVLTLSGKDFGFQGSDNISSLNVSLDSTTHQVGSITSIAHTWETTGSFNGTVDISFSYPSTLSTTAHMEVFNRDHVSGESLWNYVATCNSVDHGTYRTVTVLGVTTLNGATKGGLDWTLTGSDLDLPVELSSFTAISSTSLLLVTLQWATESETDNLGFNILRSQNTNLSDAITLNTDVITGTNTSTHHTYNFDDVTVIAPNFYYYWLENIDLNGISNFTGPVMVQVLDQGDPNTPHVIPVATKLNHAYPNPFNPETNISFDLVSASFVNITIYDVKGRKLQTLTSKEWNPGHHSVVWNGQDEYGKEVGSGVYFYHMTAGKYQSSQKVVLVK